MKKLDWSISDKEKNLIDFHIYRSCYWHRWIIINIFSIRSFGKLSLMNMVLIQQVHIMAIPIFS